MPVEKPSLLLEEMCQKVEMKKMTIIQTPTCQQSNQCVGDVSSVSGSRKNKKEKGEMPHDTSDMHHADPSDSIMHIGCILHLSRQERHSLLLPTTKNANENLTGMIVDVKVPEKVKYKQYLKNQRTQSFYLNTTYHQIHVLSILSSADKLIAASCI